jgi:hypothetical protein
VRAMRIVAVVSGLLVVLSGCWRYRVVHSTCPSETVERTPFDITVARTTGNEIRGQVVTGDSGKPIARASVDYPTSGQPSVVTAADGQFVLRAESLGVYTLRARRVGYAQALGRVRVRADSGGPLQLVVHQTTLMLDGCGYVQLREARPWWKWWFPPPAV